MLRSIVLTSLLISLVRLRCLAALFAAICRRIRLIWLQWLGSIILCIFTEPYSNALARISESESTNAIHRVLCALIILVINKRDPLSILVSCKSNLVKTSKALKQAIEFIFSYILGNITYIKTDISLLSRGLALLIVRHTQIVLAVHNVINYKFV